MGKRTNTILQSAFFKLADVMPIDDAVEFMKQAAKKSYSKKGDAVVEMNYKAIDAGLDAVHKVEIPDSWKNPVPDAPAKELEGRPEVVKLVKNLLCFGLTSISFSSQHIGKNHLILRMVR